MQQKYLQVFDEHFRKWAIFTAKAWGYKDLDDNFFSFANSRLLEGLRVTLGYGLDKGYIVDAGETKNGCAAFRPIGISKKKGPYAWFSKYTDKQIPNPNWEYYIQLAEYIRFWEAFECKGYRVDFEDNLQDITVYSGNTLFICCEIKEDIHKMLSLVDGIKKYEDGIDLSINDRGNDSLRKAKYIVQNRPQYFCLAAIGARLDFLVYYPKRNSFKLNVDMIPLV